MSAPILSTARPRLRTSLAAFVFLLCFAAPLPSMTAQIFSSNTAARTPLLDNARPVFIFAPKSADPRAVQQLDLLRDNRQGADDRDIVTLLEVEGQPTASLPGNPRLHLPAHDLDQAAARRRFKIPPGEFTVILAGKDGGEKLRSHEPIPFAKLRDTIDSMPMRQEEMRKKR